MKLNVFVSAAVAASVLSAGAVTAPAPAATNSTTEAVKALFGDSVVVKAKTFEIKRSEVDELMAGMKTRASAEGQSLPPEFEVAIVNQLVTIQLLLQKATEADRATGKEVSDAQFAKVIKNFPTPEAFARQLKAANTTEAELRAKATQEATAMAALKRELKINITEEAAKDFYAANPAKFEEPEKVRLRDILLLTVDPSTRPPTPLPTNTIAAKRKQAEDLQKRASNGEDFAKLATQYSEDPGTKNNGGEIPELYRGGQNTAPEFEAAAFALATDKVSEVITVPYGFYIIKSLGKTAARKVPFAECAAEIKEALVGAKLKETAPDYILKLRSEYDVQIVDERLKAIEDKARAAALLSSPGLPVPK
jgi:peptidyl-prolyl cis-trans isomerase C